MSLYLIIYKIRVFQLDHPVDCTCIFKARDLAMTSQDNPQPQQPPVFFSPKKPARATPESESSNINSYRRPAS